MPDIGFSPSIMLDIGVRRSYGAGRAVLVGAIVAGAALAAFATPAAETAQAMHAAGPQLTRLLRGMAGLKLVFAVGMQAAIIWRLAAPASTWRVVCFGAAGAAMSAGPVLIWDMVHIRLGALLLHGGLLAGALLLWHDPAVPARLQAMMDRRRAMLRLQG